MGEEETRKIYVLDASAIINMASLIQILKGTEKSYITEYTAKEIKSREKKMVTEALISSKKLVIVKPKKEYLKEIEKKTVETGDMLKLSKADVETLALALQFKCQNTDLTVLTDDYTMQNVLSNLKINWTPLKTKGIRKRIRWILYCPSCGSKWPANLKARDCPVCGTELELHRVNSMFLNTENSETNINNCLSSRTGHDERCDNLSRFWALVEAALVTFLWSSSYVLIKIGFAEINPLAFAAYRYIIASLMLLLFLFIFYQRVTDAMNLDFGKFLAFLFLGFTGYFIAQGLQFVGLYYLPAVTVTFILNLTPIFVLLLSVFFLRETPFLGQFVGVILKTLKAYEQSILQNTMLIQIAILANIFLAETLTLHRILGISMVFIGVLIVQLWPMQSRTLGRHLLG